MTGLVVGWEYLTGACVATDPGARDRAEWPPHPARVFMAMAAAWFESGEEPEEGAALRWLETLGEPLPPVLLVPSTLDGAERSPVTAFVPVNDRAGPSLAPVPSAPTITRSRQPRFFPRRWVGSDPCYLSWPGAEGGETHRKALDRLCSKVTRIGHSSSLVRMWVEGRARPGAGTHEEWLPHDDAPDVQLRRISPGLTELLVHRFNAEGRRRHSRIATEIDRLTLERRATKGKGAIEHKAAIDLQLQSLRVELDRTDPRPPIRPTVGLWDGYRRHATSSAVQPARTHFDADMLVLVLGDGPPLPLSSTLSATRALRGAVMKHGPQPPEPWVSGHQATGEPLTEQSGHLALVPLAFSGSLHADGHLLGLGVCFPRAIAPSERGRVLGQVLLDPTSGVPQPMELQLGPLGTRTVRLRDWSDRQRTLEPETWTAGRVGSRRWASVTPVVLDRFPKSDRGTEAATWSAEVASIVGAACQRIGLPTPVAIDVGTTCWHRGCPRSSVASRRLRGADEGGARRSASFGDGFPPFPARGTSSPRPQVHVLLAFTEPVVGPVLIGAGRYLGYGFCKPWMENTR